MRYPTGNEIRDFEPFIGAIICGIELRGLNWLTLETENGSRLRIKATLGYDGMPELEWDITGPAPTALPEQAPDGIG